VFSRSKASRKPPETQGCRWHHGAPIARLTAFCLRHRGLVVAVWLAAIALGALGTLRLPALLTSGFTLPGTDSRKVDAILQQHYGDRSDSLFVLVARDGSVRTAAAQATRTLAGGKVVDVERLPSGAQAAFVQTSLTGSAADNAIGPLRAAVGSNVIVTGDAALAHDLDPVLAHALRIGELYLAVPAALAILLLVFATASALLPFLIAAATIPSSLGLAFIAAHYLELSNYLLNMVMMIGLGIAIDYSLLVVNRYRDERRRGHGHDEAILETMRHAGRTILFSGLAVSLGLALMLLLPVPFLRGLWSRHAGWVMKRARYVAPLIVVLLVLAAMPLIGIRLGPGSPSGLPPHLQAMQGLALLQKGSVDPTTIVVDARSSHHVAPVALTRLERLMRDDPEVVSVARPVPDPSGRFFKVDVVTRHDPASTQAQAFAGRLRDSLIPAAHFPAGERVLAGGGAAYAADFISRTLGLFPWLVLAVLALTYVLLVRAFRSLLLPLKAIVLNMLTVAAASGLMIAVFQWGWGSPFGLLHVHQIEAWIPVFMFTLLFGLSMDYEVFLVTRMREAWDRTRSNTRAVSDGLAHTGRIVTAAGLIMVAAFSGMLLGSIPTMQQLGFGLAVAILIDITLVRGLLLPSTMALVGRWNWYLPRWTARALRVAGSPAGEPL